MVTETITLGHQVASLSTTHDNAPLMICIVSLQSHCLSLYQLPTLRERLLSEHNISLSPDTCIFKPFNTLHRIDQEVESSSLEVNKRTGESVVHGLY